MFRAGTSASRLRRVPTANLTSGFRVDRLYLVIAPSRKIEGGGRPSPVSDSEWHPLGNFSPSHASVPMIDRGIHMNAGLVIIAL